MLMWLWALVLGLIVSGVLLAVGAVTGHSGVKTLDKLSPFECGFNPNTSYQMMFSLHFFLISLVFLFFDLELVILFPFLGEGKWGVGLEGSLGCVIFLLVLVGGLLHEWNMSSLEWCD